MQASQSFVEGKSFPRWKMRRWQELAKLSFWTHFIFFLQVAISYFLTQWFLYDFNGIPCLILLFTLSQRDIRWEGRCAVGPCRSNPRFPFRWILSWVSHCGCNPWSSHASWWFYLVLILLKREILHYNLEQNGIWNTELWVVNIKQNYCSLSQRMSTMKQRRSSALKQDGKWNAFTVFQRKLVLGELNVNSKQFQASFK